MNFQSQYCQYCSVCSRSNGDLSIKKVSEILNVLLIISFKEFRDTYPDWGENIEKFLVNSEIYNNLKNDINIPGPWPGLQLST